ncbi:MAG: phosphomethylpyrimidine synthase ThiC [Tannerella sp.]|jgi:phosphomethylpyrimidine synthase|nr:phosphomethylpyrimidine synthase ThiC [Tannerella sp.]
MTNNDEKQVSQPKMNKVYIPGSINKLRVGMCQVALSDSVAVRDDGTKVVKSNNPVTLYDTSGPYSDPRHVHSMEHGIYRLRDSWNCRRKDIVVKEERHHHQSDVAGSAFPNRPSVYRAKNDKQITQMYYARKRIITPEMEYVAIRENQQVEALGVKSYITPDFVRKELLAGRAVIPCSINHPEAEPMIIGKRFRVKVNTQIIPPEESVQDAVERIISYCKWGTDTLLDISRHAGCLRMREWLIRNSPVPFGTSPLYQALVRVGGKAEELSWTVFRDSLIEQAEQGVDFMAIHAGMRRSHLKLLDVRLTELTSRSGIAISQWMEAHGEENFLYTHFGEICEILKAYDIVLALGCGLRPGSIYDANDPAQFAEQAEMRGLIEAAWDQSVQVMTEGPGHVPLNKIETSIKEHQYICKGLPFFSLGMTTVDIAGEFDYIASAIGSAHIAWHGAALISGVTLKDELRIPAEEDIRADIFAHKIAAHSADIAKGHPGAQVRDNALSRARREGRLEDFHILKIAL